MCTYVLEYTHTHIYEKHQNLLIECLKSLKNMFNLISIQDLMQKGRYDFIIQRGETPS